MENITVLRGLPWPVARQGLEFSDGVTAAIGLAGSPSRTVQMDAAATVAMGLAGASGRTAIISPAVLAALGLGVSVGRTVLLLAEAEAAMNLGCRATAKALVKAAIRLINIVPAGDPQVKAALIGLREIVRQLDQRLRDLEG